MPVEFNNNNEFNNTFSKPTESSGIAGWLIKKGIAKDEKTAQNYMIVVAIICFALAAYLILK